jgi:hypothetical protein
MWEPLIFIWQFSMVRYQKKNYITFQFKKYYKFDYKDETQLMEINNGFKILIKIQLSTHVMCSHVCNFIFLKGSFELF